MIEDLVASLRIQRNLLGNSSGDDCEAESSRKVGRAGDVDLFYAGIIKAQMRSSEQHWYRK